MSPFRFTGADEGSMVPSHRMYTDPPAKVGFGLEAKESVPKRRKEKESHAKSAGFS